MNEKEIVNAAMQRELDDIKQEIENATCTLLNTQDDDPNMPHLLARLGKSHSRRFDLVGELDDIDKAIEYTSIALTLFHNDDPAALRPRTNLGGFYCKRFQRLQELDDCNKAIESISLALKLTPNDHPYVLALVLNLAASYSGRYKRLGEMADLTKAIEYETQALNLTPDDHPRLSGVLANLGTSHSDRYERLGDISDLHKAIEYETRALSLTPDGHPRLSSRLSNLGVSHKIRFQHLGEIGDLEKAIEYHSQALALTPDGHPLIPTRLSNLGESHGVGFNRLGEIGDLEKAIAYESQAVALTPEGHPHMSARLTNLALFLKNRFRRLGETIDLDKAIEYESQALTLTHNSYLDLPRILANLGVSHSERFKHLGKIGDLEKAVEYESRAVALTPDGHPNLPDRLYSLGVSYSHRYSLFQQEEDLEKVIEFTSCAIELTPDGHPTLPHKHFPLAAYRIRRYMRTRDLSDLQDSLTSFRIASQSRVASPRDKFGYAFAWARMAFVESSLNPIEACQAAIDLLPQFIWLGATTFQRYQDLEEAQSLAALAALTTIRSSQYTLALEWLELTRCVVWNQQLMLRSPLDQLNSRDSKLATRLKTITAQLHHAGAQSRDSEVLLSGSLTPEQVTQQHRRLAQEYDNLIKQARTLPGFEDFLRPIKANDLVRAARNGPIVVINCHENSCDALVIIPGKSNIDCVPLPNFTGKKALTFRQEMEQSVRNHQPRERGVERRPVLEQVVGFESVLVALWYDVVKPVLDFLGYIENVTGPDSPLPHITWCPTGALSFLPLHAAGDYDQSQSRVFDYVISSYTPTLTALLSSTQSSLSCDSRVLAIAQPNTPGHFPLPGTTEELEYVQNHVSGKVNYSQLIDKQATTAAVLEAMEQHDWVHLACHAHQNVQDPTKSGFFLHDDALDLTSINQRSFKNKGLAYLSACQTATGDERLPDEAIHLASGMLMAGYSSVIATMWSVRDDDAPFVADKVYAQLMRDGKLGGGEAGKALHYAVGELRKKVGEKAFGRWVPYIHIGS